VIGWPFAYMWAEQPIVGEYQHVGSVAWSQLLTQKQGQCVAY
jgi:hypothetical protein